MALPNDGVPPDCRDDLNPPPAPPSCIDNLCLLLRRVVVEVEVPFRIDVDVVVVDDVILGVNVDVLDRELT